MNPFVDAGRWLLWDDRAASSARAAPRALDIRAVHAEHADFVWRSLQQLGVRDPDLDDLLQEVFVVVHQRLHTYDGSVHITAWLFGVCRRVAAAHRRRAYVRREQASDTLPDTRDDAQDPEQAAAARQARERLRQVLDEMDIEKRVIFVMFEIDELGCEQIAQILGVPVGTVYSRLHAARKAFEKALARVEARAPRRSS